MKRKMGEFDYLGIEPISETFRPRKQAAKRHYGAHPYFTRRAWNVVQEYIRRYSQPGDIVCDPFGGSGVTAVEALVLRRKAIHVDINPLANFICDQIATAEVGLGAFEEAFRAVEKECRARIERLQDASDAEVAKMRVPFWYPKDVPLPRNADVRYVHELFTRRHLIGISRLHHAIHKTKDQQMRNLLLFVLSATLNKCNRTFRSTPGRKASRGDSGIKTVYRYWVPERGVELPLWTEFESKYRAVVRAKTETNLEINGFYEGNLRILKASATSLSEHIEAESVDYIFTDPPYGDHIAYLDLSVMWNAWLGLGVSDEDKLNEVIEGGDQEKSKAEYEDSLRRSIEEMFKILKFGRWMSVVFFHKDPSYWDTIRQAALDAGFEYAGCCVQAAYSPSIHKRKNPLTVLSGELVLDFRKVRSPRVIAVSAVGKDVTALVLNTAELAIVRGDGASTEAIYQALIPTLLENGLLGELKERYEDVTPLLEEEFDYSTIAKQWHLREGRRLGTFIPLEERIRFYVADFLHRCAREGREASFDDIVLNVMPKLVNGSTPSKQSILKELELVAQSDDGVHWRLKSAGVEQKLMLDLPVQRGRHVAVPDLPTPLDEREITHLEMIYRLACLGKAASFAVWVGKNEQKDSYNDVSLGELSMPTFPIPKSKMTEKQRRKVTQIDLLWFNGMGVPVFAFEVENTPVITGALDRFTYLLEVEPATAGNLVVIAPSWAKARVYDELGKSRYIGHPLYMENKVRYAFYPEIIRIYDAGKRLLDRDLVTELLASLRDPRLDH